MKGKLKCLERRRGNDVGKEGKWRGEKKRKRALNEVQWL